MKQPILLLFIFSLSFAFCQDDKMTSSEIFGYWKFDHINSDSNGRIHVFMRAQSDEETTLYHFKENGTYSLVHYKRRNRYIRKCGNKICPRNQLGTFHIYNNKNYLELYDNNSRTNQNWKIVWLDENSFGVIR